MSAKPKIEKDSEGEKPGTSASFLVSSRRNSDTLADIPSQDSSDENSQKSFLKARNASRERPIQDIPKLKKQRISHEGDDHRDEDDGVDMDTASSSEDQHDIDVDVDDNEPIDEDSEQDPDVLTISEHVDPSTAITQASSRRSSNADENVTTTIPASSPLQRSGFSDDRPDSNIVRFAAGDAIASTSAAALAAPLSKMMEESVVLNDLYRLPTFSTEEGRVRSRNQDLQTGFRQEATPASGSLGDTDNLYFQKHKMDVSESGGPEEFLQKMHGKQRLMWARKLFFLSTELVFPGFKACSDNKNQMPDYLGVRVRSSVLMQALLYADALFFIMWVLSFLSTCDILITVLKQLHGYLFMCLACLFIAVNTLRLHFGIKGNQNDEVQYLALFFMTTVIVQIPLFTFIFLTDLFCPVLMAFTVTMDGTMMAFILLESIVGFIHFRSLLRDELNVIRMARRSKEASQSRANVLPSADNDHTGPHAMSSLNPSRKKLDVEGDSSSETDSENSMSNDRMDFRMQIRRLSDSQSRLPHPEAGNDDSDSSEQVTSTSDTIRQRSVRAH